MDINKLKLGANNRKPVKWPGTKETVYIKVLSDFDYNTAVKETDLEYKDRGINLANVTERSCFIEQYCLFLSIVDEKGKRLFDDFKTFSECLTHELRLEFCDIQMAWQEECSPNIDYMPDKEFNVLLKEVKKNPEKVKNISSTSLLRRLIITLAVRPVKLQTGN